MEQLMLDDSCDRPLHAQVDEWQQGYRGLGVDLWMPVESPIVVDIDRVRKAAMRRAERWLNWHDGLADHDPSTSKLAEAKMQTFYRSDKHERIARGLAALTEPVSFVLKTETLRQALKESYFEDPE
jgi:hypothetical protein